MQREEQGKNICDCIDQLISTDELLNNKTKLYCEFCLSLGKEYVDSITDNLYEKCENYLKNYSSNSEKEEQFIKSYESILAWEGEKICKEIESIGGVNNNLLVRKAFLYCNANSDFNTQLYEKCVNYTFKVLNFDKLKNAFLKNNDERELNNRYKNRKI